MDGDHLEETPHRDGLKIFSLLTEQPHWIHRRVDRLHLESDGETTRHISFDFTVTEDLAVRRQGGIVLPLMLVTKTPLRRLDTLGPDGRACPVLSRGQNGRLACDALSAAFHSVYPVLGPEVQRLIEEAVFEDDPTMADKRVAALREALRDTAPALPVTSEVILALAGDLSRQFMFALLAPEQHVGRRSIVKISFGEVLPVAFRDWVLNGEGRAFDTQLHTEDAAESVHFEFQAPSGLKVTDTRIFDTRRRPLEIPAPSILQGHTVHLTGLDARVADPDDEDEGGGPLTAAISLAPTRDGLVRQTALAAAVVWFALLACALNTDRIASLVAANRVGTIAAVVLAAPALFLTLQARPPEHAAVARALFAQRALNLVMAIVLYAAAVGLVLVPASPDAVATLLWPLLTVHSGLTLYAGWSLWR